MNDEKITSNSDDLPKPEVIRIEQQIDSSQGDIEDAQVDAVLSEKLDRKFDAHIVPWIFGIW